MFILKTASRQARKKNHTQNQKQTGNTMQGLSQVALLATSCPPYQKGVGQAQQTDVHRHRTTQAAWPHCRLSLQIKKCLSPTDRTATSTRRDAGQKGEKEGGPFVSVQVNEELEKTQGYPGSSRLQEWQLSRHRCLCHTLPGH